MEEEDPKKGIKYTRLENPPVDHFQLIITSSSEKTRENQNNSIYQSIKNVLVRGISTSKKIKLATLFGQGMTMRDSVIHRNALLERNVENRTLK